MSGNSPVRLRRIEAGVYETPDGKFQNLTQARYAYPMQERGAGVVRRHRGMIQYLSTLRGAETAGNVAA